MEASGKTGSGGRRAQLGWDRSRARIQLCLTSLASARGRDEEVAHVMRRPGEYLCFYLSSSSLFLSPSSQRLPSLTVVKRSYLNKVICLVWSKGFLSEGTKVWS